MAGRLEGKVAIVTGAGSGVGETTAERFAAEGARVTCADINVDAAEATVARINKSHGKSAIAVRVNIAIPAEVESMVAQTLKAFGTVDALYANAGTSAAGSAMDTTFEDWNHMISVNLTGTWLSCKYVLPVMVKAGRGSIVTQSTIGALVGIHNVASYAASKAGVIGLTRQMAVDFGPKGIRANAICPATMPTPLVKKVWAEGASYGGPGGWEEQKARAAGFFPMRRLGKTDDCASLALFLASDESSWMTGLALALDGGLSAGPP